MEILTVADYDRQRRGSSSAGDGDGSVLGQQVQAGGGGGHGPSMCPTQTHSQTQSPATKRRRRGGRPCDACRKRKSRCLIDGLAGNSRVCVHCRLRDTPCTFELRPPDRLLPATVAAAELRTARSSLDHHPAMPRRPLPQEHLWRQEPETAAAAVAVAAMRGSPATMGRGGELERRGSMATKGGKDAKDDHINDGDEADDIDTDGGGGGDEDADIGPGGSNNRHGVPTGYCGSGRHKTATTADQLRLLPGDEVPTLGLKPTRFAELYGLGSDMEPILMRHRPYDPFTQEFRLETHAIRRVLERDSNGDATVDYPLTFHMVADTKALASDPDYRRAEAIEACVRPHGPRLVELFWRHVQPCYPLLHRGVFMQQYNGGAVAVAPATAPALAPASVPAMHGGAAPGRSSGAATGTATGPAAGTAGGAGPTASAAAAAAASAAALQSRYGIGAELLGAVYLSALRWWTYDPELSLRPQPDAAWLRRLLHEALSAAYHRPKLSTIQAVLLLLQCQPEDPLNPDHSYAWGLTCQALAIGQCLGLHLDASRWSVPAWERHVRKRLSWALFLQDQWTALAYGRPVHLHMDDWTVQPLTDEDFADLLEGTAAAAAAAAATTAATAAATTETAATEATEAMEVTEATAATATAAAGGGGRSSAGGRRASCPNVRVFFMATGEELGKAGEHHHHRDVDASGMAEAVSAAPAAPEAPLAPPPPPAPAPAPAPARSPTPAPTSFRLDDRRSISATGKTQFVLMVQLAQILSRVQAAFYTARASLDQDTVVLWRRAQPLLDELQAWWQSIPPALQMGVSYPRKLAFQGHLHFSYYGVLIAVLRRLIRSTALPPRCGDDRVLSDLRQLALQTVQGAIAFTSSLRPDQLEAFWYFTSPYLFSLVGSFTTLLLVTSLSSQERHFWQETLNSYLWHLRTMSKSSEPMRYAVNRLEGAILRGLEHALAVNLHEPVDDTVSPIMMGPEAQYYPGNDGRERHRDRASYGGGLVDRQQQPPAPQPPPVPPHLQQSAEVFQLQALQGQQPLPQPSLQPQQQHQQQPQQSQHYPYPQYPPHQYHPHPPPAFATYTDFGDWDLAGGSLDGAFDLLSAMQFVPLPLPGDGTGGGME